MRPRAIYKTHWILARAGRPLSQARSRGIALGAFLGDGPQVFVGEKSLSARKLKRIAVRIAVTAFQALRRALWAVTQPRVEGVHAVALTPQGRVVLVRLTYARGWHLPGGGRKKGEPEIEAMLRELREEIGMTSHGQVQFRYRFRHRPDNREAVNTVYLVRDVVYSPRQTFEVEEVLAFDPHSLPPDVTDLSRANLHRALDMEDV